MSDSRSAAEKAEDGQPPESARLRAVARDLFEEAVAAADPVRCVEASAAAVVPAESRWLSLGKAAAGMAEGLLRCSSVSGHGLVVVPRGRRTKQNHPLLEARLESGRVRWIEGEHPVAGNRSVAAALEVEAFLAKGRNEPLVVLISGGASALLLAPIPGVRWQEKSTTVDALMKAGASIWEVNLLRRQLSRLKGGGFAKQALRGHSAIRAFLLSDVIDDDPLVIGGGLLSAEVRGPRAAMRLLQQYGLWERCYPNLRVELSTGRGTTALSANERERIEQTIVGSNRQSVEAVVEKLEALNMEAFVREEMMVGEAVSGGRLLAQELLRVPRGATYVGGGETTVAVQGEGLGGRNQELGLAFALALEASDFEREWAFLAAGTDGRDGPTEAAGALVDRTTVARSRELGLDLEGALRDNNSHAVLDALGDTFVSGATGTNVADIFAVVVGSKL